MRASISLPVDPTLCPYTAFQYFLLSEDQYREPDDSWEHTLRTFIQDIKLNDKVFADYFTLLKKVTSDGKGP